MPTLTPPARPTSRRLPPLTDGLALLVCIVLLILAVPPPAGADQPAPARGVWPLRPVPEVVQRFDPPDVRWGAGHRGVDLAGRAGAPVRASLAGRISFAGRIAGRGVVVVDHGTSRTTYEPVSATVAVGDRVRAGAVTGRLEVFGSHCFPQVCLHWGLIEGAEHYLDPLTLVGVSAVRLLPLHVSRSSGSAVSLGGRRSLSGPGELGGSAEVVSGTRSTGTQPGFSPAQARGWAWR